MNRAEKLLQKNEINGKELEFLLSERVKKRDIVHKINASGMGRLRAR